MSTTPACRFTVQDFTATYRRTDSPEDFVTHAELLDAAGGPVQTVDILGPVGEIDGVKFYQFGYGWAPVIRVEHDGVPIFDRPVVCRQDPPRRRESLQLPGTAW